MPKIISCGIAPIRKNGEEIEILLCVPTKGYTPSGSHYGMGFLKGQVEEGESNLEAGKREFAEESGNLEVELYDEEIYFVQNNPKKKIFIWPAKVSETNFNYDKISSEGIIYDHDDENDLIKFFPINDLPTVFKNQRKILDELIEFIKQNGKDLF